LKQGGSFGVGFLSHIVQAGKLGMFCLAMGSARNLSEVPSYRAVTNGIWGGTQLATYGTKNNKNFLKQNFY
jgi:hypothetical protein